jgi:hypothetical protein
LALGWLRRTTDTTYGFRDTIQNNRKEITTRREKGPCQSDPEGVSVLLAISREFGKSADWLMTKEEKK